MSVQSPLLDTYRLPSWSSWGTIFLGPSVLAVEELRLPMLVLCSPPVLHRSFNLIGYKIGWKDVPY